MKGKFFTTEQVANILQVHPFTILKYIKSGKLQGIKIGRVYRITESAVDAFLEERMTHPSKKVKEEKKEINIESAIQTEAVQSINKTSQDVETKTKLSNSDHYYII